MSIPTPEQIAEARWWFSFPQTNDMGAREFSAMNGHVRVLLDALAVAQKDRDEAHQRCTQWSETCARVESERKALAVECDEARLAGRREIIAKCRKRFPHSTFYLAWEKEGDS